MLVAGTGSVCFGRLADGRSWRAGGLGPSLDDGGSGHWIGMQALRVLVRVADGRAPLSPFVDVVAAKLGTRASRDVLRLVCSSGNDHTRIAALAPVVLAAAAAGDVVANDIAQRGAAELAAMAEAVLRNLGLDRIGAAHLAAAGGLLENETGYRRMVAAEVARRVPGARLKRAVLPPCAGAVMLALGLTGRPVGPDIVGKLKTKAAAEAAAC